MRTRTVLTSTGLIAAALLAGAGSAAAATSGDEARGHASCSPGALSGDVFQAPLSVPVDATGNSGNVIGILNPTSGNESANR